MIAKNTMSQKVMDDSFFFIFITNSPKANVPSSLTRSIYGKCVTSPGALTALSVARTKEGLTSVAAEPLLRAGY